MARCVQHIGDPRGFLSDSAMFKNVCASWTYMISTLEECRYHEGPSLSLTVSAAIMNEEGTKAVEGLNRSRGALFWISRANLAILRREKEGSRRMEDEWYDSSTLLKNEAEESRPKEIEWNDSDIL